MSHVASIRNALLTAVLSAGMTMAPALASASTADAPEVTPATAEKTPAVTPVQGWGWGGRGPSWGGGDRWHSKRNLCLQQRQRCLQSCRVGSWGGGWGGDRWGSWGGGRDGRWGGGRDGRWGGGGWRHPSSRCVSQCDFQYRRCLGGRNWVW